MVDSTRTVFGGGGLSALPTPTSSRCEFNIGGYPGTVAVAQDLITGLVDEGAIFDGPEVVAIPEVTDRFGVVSAGFYLVTFGINFRLFNPRNERNTFGSVRLDLLVNTPDAWGGTAVSGGWTLETASSGGATSSTSLFLPAGARLGLRFTHSFRASQTGTDFVDVNLGYLWVNLDRFI